MGTNREREKEQSSLGSGDEVSQEDDEEKQREKIIIDEIKEGIEKADSCDVAYEKDGKDQGCF